MTTGSRLRNTSALLTVAKLLLNATAWCVLGTYIGWKIGNDGGFNRGVRMTTDLVIELMHKPDLVDKPAPYKDL
jgi:hypothetical protein